MDMLVLLDGLEKVVDNAKKTILSGDKVMEDPDAEYGYIDKLKMKDINIVDNIFLSNNSFVIFFLYFSSSNIKRKSHCIFFCFFL